MQQVRSDTPRFSIRGLLLLTVIVAVLAAVVAGAQRISARKKAEIARLTEQSDRTKVRIVQRIEAIRAQLGRVPRDQTELEELLGEPMPAAYEDGIAEPIGYRKTGASRYQLMYTSYYDDDWNYDSDWIYDSAAPKAGWVHHYFD
jgi:hypothetical protein